MVAAIYTRISDDREQTGLGVQRQEDDCRKLAKRRGWKVKRVYCDNDISAFKGRRRPEYERLCADIGKGDIDSVIAWDPDRLHRSTTELETFIALVEQTGAKVETVNAGEYDLSSATGRM